jgi:LacI family transcriptional regulator
MQSSVDKQKRKPTRSDVAQLAGVDKSTVSRVMTGHRAISQATRLKVLKVAEDIGYRPNALARMLASQRSRLIGIIINSLWTGLQTEMFRHCQIAAEDHGYQVLMCEARADPAVQKAYIQRFVDLNVDGLVLIPIDGVEQVLSTLSDTIPIVTMDNWVDVEGISRIRLDNFESMYRLTEHLAGMGHRHIGLIAGRENDKISLARQCGFEAAIESAGVSARYVRLGEYQANGGYRMGVELLREYPQITAMVVMGTHAATGAMRAAAEMGRRIPETLSIVSFDDSPFLAEGMPPVTCIAQPVEEIGRKAVVHIIQRLDHQEVAPAEFVMEGRLIIRESCRRI